MARLQSPSGQPMDEDVAESQENKPINVDIDPQPQPQPQLQEKSRQEEQQFIELPYFAG